MTSLKAKTAALYLKSWMDHIRTYWAYIEQDLTVEEQAEAAEYFDSAERTFLKNRITGTTKQAKRKL